MYVTAGLVSFQRKNNIVFTHLCGKAIGLTADTLLLRGYGVAIRRFFLFFVYQYQSFYNENYSAFTNRQ